MWRKGTPSYIVGGNVNWYKNKKNSTDFSQKNKNRVAIYSEIPLLGIYFNKTLIQKDTCIPTFTAALFTIAKAWKQPKFPLKMKR